MAASLLSPEQAERVVSEQWVDLVGLAREALLDPNWPLHAGLKLEGQVFAAAAWPEQAEDGALRDRLNNPKTEVNSRHEGVNACQNSGLCCFVGNPDGRLRVQAV